MEKQLGGSGKCSFLPHPPNSRLTFCTDNFQERLHWWGTASSRQDTCPSVPSLATPPPIGRVLLFVRYALFCKLCACPSSTFRVHAYARACSSSHQPVRSHTTTCDKRILCCKHPVLKRRCLTTETRSWYIMRESIFQLGTFLLQI